MTDSTQGPLWAPAGPAAPAPAPTAPAPAAGGQVEVRRYRGNENRAYAAFEADARTMAAAGWFPTTQSYVPGTWGCGAWLLAFILLIFVIGIIVLAYMIVARPDGELVVTYEYRGPALRTELSSAATRSAMGEPAGAAGPGASATPADPAAPAPAMPAPTAPPDPVEQLRKLGELRDADLITAEEFEAKKAEILGRL